MVATSACALACDTPGARRPLSVRFRASRASSDAAFGSVSNCGDIISGTKKSVRRNAFRPVNSAGATPIDRERMTVDVHAAAEDGRVRRELLLPQGVPEHDHRVAAGDQVLSGPEGAPESGLDAHHPEQIAAGEHAQLQGGHGAGMAGESRRHVGEGDQAVEALAAVADVHVVAVRRLERARPERLERHRRADGDHVARSGDGKGPQQQRVGEAEDGAVGADADRQREDGHQR